MSFREFGHDAQLLVCLISARDCVCKGFPQWNLLAPSLDGQGPQHRRFKVVEADTDLTVLIVEINAGKFFQPCVVLVRDQLERGEGVEQRVLGYLTVFRMIPLKEGTQERFVAPFVACRYIFPNRL